MIREIEAVAMDDGGVGRLFQAHYRVSIVRYMPDADVTMFPFFTEHPTTSTVVKVEPNDGRPWYGDIRSKADCDGRFWGTRDPYCCCALFGMCLYWFDVRDPSSVVGYRVDHGSSGTILFAKSQNLLVFCEDPIEAYGPDGHRWCTGRIAFDEILDAVVDGDVLRGVSDTYPEGSVPFEVDLATGHHTGGFPGWEALGARRLD